ncbi:MAG: tetratricopeptide repeat protein [Bacteroidaceae bacterium]|nr:tetratricopeptide repeat protein [Bacteroidaceae bacterium]
MKRTIAFTICHILFTIGLLAANLDSLKVAADSAYAKEQFAQAAQLYQQIAREGESPAICYNLGNAYYRQDDIAHALLWYERAYLLNPGDADIRFNLDMARSKTIDRVTPQHEFFFVTWWKQLINAMSADAWARLSILLFVLCLLSLAVYIYASPIWLRKVGFTLAVVLLLLTILGNVCAFGQRYRLTHRTGAIVMSSAATVKSTPSQSGSDLFVLHEGTYVSIRDNTLDDWTEISLADGKQGWIQSKQIEGI